MRQIYKYPLQLLDSQMLSLPEDPIILSVAEQCGALHLWAEVEDSNPYLPLEILIRTTGNQFLPADNTTFIGTVVMADNDVYHIYHKKE